MGQFWHATVSFHDAVLDKKRAKHYETDGRPASVHDLTGLLARFSLCCRGGFAPLVHQAKPG